MLIRPDSSQLAQVNIGLAALAATAAAGAGVALTRAVRNGDLSRLGGLLSAHLPWPTK